MLSSIFHFGQVSKFKKGVTPRKKWNENFLWICASTHYVLYNYKVSRNSVERFQRSCANKKNWTDGLTDWLTDGSKTLYPLQLVAWGIIIYKCTIIIVLKYRKPGLMIESLSVAFRSVQEYYTHILRTSLYVKGCQL